MPCLSFLSRGRRWEPTRVLAPLPCPPHTPSGLAAGSPVVAGPSPAEKGPRATSPRRPADSPNNGAVINIIKQQVHFPRTCPSMAPVSQHPAWHWGVDGDQGEPSQGVSGAWSPPGLGLCASALPARPPWRTTPIKRRSSCLVDNKTFFFSLLQLVYCIKVSAAQPSPASSKPPQRTPDPRGRSWMGCRTLPSSCGMDPSTHGSSIQVAAPTWVTGAGMAWEGGMQTGRVTPSAPASSSPAGVGAGIYPSLGWSSPWDPQHWGQSQKPIARDVHGGLECACPTRDEFAAF